MKATKIDPEKEPSRQQEGSQDRALSAHEILDFVLRHSFQSLLTLSKISSINPGNLRASLLGIRPVPIEQMRRLSAAVGLRLQVGMDTEWTLSIEPVTVINLNVAFEELVRLANLIQSLSNQPPIWRFLSATRGRGKGSFWTAVALIHTDGDLHSSDGFVAAHIADVLDEKSQQHALAVLSPRASMPVQAMTSLDSRWIRLRAGLYTTRELGTLYKIGDQAEPTAKEWAQMLGACADYGLRPADVMSLMKVQYESRTDGQSDKDKCQQGELRTLFPN